VILNWGTLSMQFDFRGRFNPIAKRVLAYASEFSGGKALFLEHADFLGAIGALLA